MAKGGLSDKEAALIAEARAALARKAAGEAAAKTPVTAPPATTPPPSPPPPASAAAPRAAATRPATGAASLTPAARPASAPAPASAAMPPATDARPKTDPAVIAARIAAMMEAEREQTMRRKQKMKQTGTTIVVVGFVPVILWAAYKLIAQLLGR